MLDLIYIAALEACTEITNMMAGLNKSLFVFARDFELLSSLYLARFIVWYELRKPRNHGRVM